jgi:hypothetical protein
MCKQVEGTALISGKILGSARSVAIGNLLMRVWNVPFWALH